MKRKLKCKRKIKIKSTVNDLDTLALAAFLVFYAAYLT